MKIDCKQKHRLRQNKFGVTWCTECGMLSNSDAKPLDKNFTINTIKK